MVVWLLQRCALGLMTESLAPLEREEAARELPEPVHKGGWPLGEGALNSAA